MIAHALEVPMAKLIAEDCPEGSTEEAEKGGPLRPLEDTDPTLINTRPMREVAGGAGLDNWPLPDNSALPDRPKSQGKEIPVNVPSQGVRVELTLLDHYDHFSAKDEADLLRIIKAVAGITEEIRIIFRRRGSVILTLGLSGEDAERLCRAVNEGALADRHVVDCRRLPDFPESNASLRLCQNPNFGLCFGVFKRFWQSLFGR